MQINTYIFYIV